MAVSFDQIRIGESYSRPDLARLWGYSGYQAIARGVVTPQNDNKIILFVTEEKQSFQEQYQDRLSGSELQWEEPTDHFAQDRILNALSTGEEIHLFHRLRHHSDFTYCGKLELAGYEFHSSTPSIFKFKVV